MYLELEPDNHIDINSGVGSPSDIHEAAQAMFESATFLEAFGADSTPKAEDKHAARAVMMGKAGLKEVKTSATAKHLRALLEDYDHQIIKNFAEIRQYIVNRLIEESQPGNKNAIRALDMLGKVSGIDLFVERSEVTVRTQTTSELQKLIRERLARVSKNTEIIDVPYKDAEPEVAELKENPIEAAKEVLDAFTD